MCPGFEPLYPSGDPQEQRRGARAETAHTLRQGEPGEQIDEVVLAEVHEREAER